MEKKVWENIGYVVLIGLMCGQILIGFNFVLGECIYVVTDILVLMRDFKLHNPTSDKIKNSIMCLLAGGSILINCIQ